MNISKHYCIITVDSNTVVIPTQSSMPFETDIIFVLILVRRILDTERHNHAYEHVHSLTVINIKSL